MLDDTKKEEIDKVKDCDSKQAIFNQAARLFAVKGFHGTSVRDISTAAGVNVALINYHFKTKQNLFNEVALYGFARIEKSKSDLRGLPPKELIEKTYLKNIDMENGDGYYVVVIMNLFTSPQQLNLELAHTIIRDHKSEWMDTMVQAVKREVPENTPEEELVRVAFMINGNVMWMSQTSFGLMEQESGFLKEFYPGESPEQVRINYLYDQADRLINELRTKYSS